MSFGTLFNHIPNFSPAKYTKHHHHDNHGYHHRQNRQQDHSKQWQLHHWMIPQCFSNLVVTWMISVIYQTFKPSTLFSIQSNTVLCLPFCICQSFYLANIYMLFYLGLILGHSKWHSLLPFFYEVIVLIMFKIQFCLLY